MVFKRERERATAMDEFSCKLWTLQVSGRYYKRMYLGGYVQCSQVGKPGIKSQMHCLILCSFEQVGFVLFFETGSHCEALAILEFTVLPRSA